MESAPAYRNDGRDRTKDASLTEKAQRCAALSASLRHGASSLEGRIFGPMPEAAAMKSPDPDALPWILEKIESDLEQANRVIGSLNERV